MNWRSNPKPVSHRIKCQIGRSERIPRRWRIPVAGRLILALALLIAIGTILLLLPGMTTSRLTVGEAMFTATSASTVTGLTVVITSTSFTLLGQITLLVIMQLGGLGFVVVVVLLVRLFGMRVSLLDRLAATSEFGLDKPTAIFLILRRSVIFMLLVEALGTFSLYLHWRISGIVPPEIAFFYALFHAVSVFCNAGFDLFAGLPAYPFGLPSDNLSLIIMGVLVILGGLGFPVFMEMLTRRKRGRISPHSRLTIRVAIILIIIGWVGLLISEVFRGGVLSTYPLNERIVQAWFQSVSTRTAGFPGLDSFNFVRQESQWLIVALMFIGSAPASMGGGITTGTFTVVCVTVWSYIKGYRDVRVNKRAISIGTVKRALAVLAISLGVVVIVTWLILVSGDFTIDKALFEVVSAFSTCGLSMGITTELNTFGRLLISLMMFWGRLGALTIMIALLQRGSSNELVEYEETVLVGYSRS